jgi:hypothetical protein
MQQDAGIQYYEEVVFSTPHAHLIQPPRLLLVGVPEGRGMSQKTTDTEDLWERLKRRVPLSQWTPWPRLLTH